MITQASITLGLRSLSDYQARVSEADKQLLRDQDKAIADAIGALTKGHVRHARDILDKYIKTQEV